MIRDTLPTLLLIVSIASVSIAFAQTPEVSPFAVITTRGLEALERIGVREIDSPRRNDLLLGLREPFLWFLAPLFVLVCVGVIIVVSKVSYVAMLAISALWNRIPSFPWLGATQWLDRTVPWLAVILRWIGSWWATEPRYLQLLSSTDYSVMYNGNVSATSSRTKRRIIVTLALLFVVATVVPFQFAYVVACVVQFSSCVKALNRTREVTREVTTPSYLPTDISGS